MPIADDTSPAVSETSSEYWSAELLNARDRLYKLNLAINTLVQGNHQSYLLDSGQSQQRVTRFDLPQLYAEVEKLMEQIRRLEILLGEGKPTVKQVRPAW